MPPAVSEVLFRMDLVPMLAPSLLTVRSLRAAAAVGGKGRSPLALRINEGIAYYTGTRWIARDLDGWIIVWEEVFDSRANEEPFPCWNWGNMIRESKIPTEGIVEK